MPGHHGQGCRGCVATGKAVGEGRDSASGFICPMGLGCQGRAARMTTVLWHGVSGVIALACPRVSSMRAEFDNLLKNMGMACASGRMASAGLVENHRIGPVNGSAAVESIPLRGDPAPRGSRAGIDSRCMVKPGRKMRSAGRVWPGVRMASRGCRALLTRGKQTCPHRRVRIAGCCNLPTVSLVSPPLTESAP